MNNVMRLICLTAIVCALSIGMVTSVMADGDVGMTLSNGKLATGLISEDGLTYTPNVRVFDSEVTNDNLPMVWDTEEPGFQSYENLLPNVQLRIDLLGPLQQWDGNEFVTSNCTLTVQNPTGFGTTTTGNGVVNGFWMSANSVGYFHQHPPRTLNGAGGNAPADGVYLLLVKIESDNSNASASDPFAIIYGKNADDADIANAVAWAQTNVVPEPASLLALGVGIVGMLGFKRRR